MERMPPPLSTECPGTAACLLPCHNPNGRKAAQTARDDDMQRRRQEEEEEEEWSF
jgi:hypothetical protein